MIYDKKALTIDEQIDQLIDRGLVITNRDKAAKYLINVSYYRLSGYWWPLQSDKLNHRFKAGSRFETVTAIYNFDAELRLLIFGVIEKIEISLRTKLIYYLSHAYGPWWFTDSTLFKNHQALIKTIDTLTTEVKRSKDTFIKEHKKKYRKDSRLPPSWKTLELSSLGGLSRFYGNLRNNLPEKDTIAREFGAVNHTFLPSWLQAISQIRNICAHHGRLWNKNLPATVKILPKPPNPWITQVPTPDEYKELYIHLCVMKYLLDTIHPKNKMSKNLKSLFDRYPTIDQNALGMKQDWTEEELWR